MSRTVTTMPPVRPHSTESALARLFPNERFARDRIIPDAPTDARPSYRCERLKLIVQCDGPPHYRESGIILQDRQQDAAFETMGYRVVRIPYFVQWSAEVAEHLFGRDGGLIEPAGPQGFVGDDMPLPADFCALGIERFLQDLKRFHAVAKDIVTSLRAQVRHHRDPRRVVPPELKELVADHTSETEGVTKFQLDFRESPPPETDTIAVLNAWRTVLHRLGLTSQDPLRYGGLAFGNVSRRVAGTGTNRPAPLFVISGSQTGGLPRLTERHYCRVTAFDVRENRLSAEGPIRPSSESLTHAAVYLAAPAIQCVLHVHSPEIWRQAQALGIPSIDRSIVYGTPEMAKAVGALVIQRQSGILAMGGHKDGIVAYGLSVEETAAELIGWFARALQLPADSAPGPGDPDYASATTKSTAFLP